jgi:hypothetical protein
VTARSYYAAKREAARKGIRTGWCNASWSLDTPDGRASHERCTFAACVCECHRPPEPTTGDTTVKITEPGLVRGMSDETYHADPVPEGSLSSSFARRLTEHVPAKAYATHHNRKPTKSMNLGKAAHLHALGAGPELVVWEHDGRTKAGKEERAERAADIAAERIVAVTEAERDQVLGMAAALRADPEVAALLDAGTPEVSVFWQERGAWCRGRFDLLGEVGDDYKTTDDASARGFEKAMATYGYHQQADFYLRGLRAIGHPAGDRPMRFICQETQAPYLVQVHTCDDLAMEIAAALNDRAIDIYAEAKRSGEWAGYPSLYAEPTSLPSHYFFRYADLLPDHLNPYAEPEMSM